MRLINTRSLRLEEHNDQQLPPYAILSHRWYADEEEVTFEDLDDRRDVRHKRGFAKLEKFCDLAYSFGYDYAWSDVCCINKHASMELETALNSMFGWYAGSKLCIAYLEDVHRHRKPFEKSEWFKRGWTLQELIAPANMLFYDGDWRRIGRKIDLLDTLSKITGVQKSILSHGRQPRSCSIAQRMSWAAGRITKRVEDRAYSLLGLFDVTLATVYDGNGEGAFLRLQEKIIQYSADQSIFAWPMEEKKREYSGLLASSPDCFASCGDLVQTQETRGFALENIGLSIRLPTIPYSMGAYLAVLDCSIARLGPDCRTAILVARLPEPDQWARTLDAGGTSLFQFDHRGAHKGHMAERQLYIRQALQPPTRCLYQTRVYAIWLRKLEPFRNSKRVRILSRVPTNAQDRVCLAPGLIGTAGVVSVEAFREKRDMWSQIRWIKVGFDVEFRPTIMVANRYGRGVARHDSKEFDKASSGEPGSKVDSGTFRNDWLEPGFLQSDLSERNLPAAEDRWDKGYHILAPRDLPGENASRVYKDLDALNIRIKISLMQTPSSTKAKTSDFSSTLSRYIWTIDFIKLDGPSPERIYRESKLSLFGKKAWHFTQGMAQGYTMKK